jgi:Methenyl tetrahydrofolate cyclohydrolase
LLTKLTISEFAAKLGSREPAQGGGSAAALSGLLGASLVAMTISLTRGHEEFAASESLLAEQANKLRCLRRDLEQLIDRDAAAFCAVLAAGNMPQASRAEEQARDAAFRQAIKEAAEVPLLTARACLEVLESARLLAGSVIAPVASELMVGALAAHTGLTGALLNTAINLPALQDDLLGRSYTGQIRHLRAAADEAAAAIKNRIYSAPTFAVMRE